MFKLFITKLVPKWISIDKEKLLLIDIYNKLCLEFLRKQLFKVKGMWTNHIL